MLKYIR